MKLKITKNSMLELHKKPLVPDEEILDILNYEKLEKDFESPSRSLPKTVTSSNRVSPREEKPDLSMLFIKAYEDNRQNPDLYIFK